MATIDQVGYKKITVNEEAAKEAIGYKGIVQFQPTAAAASGIKGGVFKSNVFRGQS